MSRWWRQCDCSTCRPLGKQAAAGFASQVGGTLSATGSSHSDQSAGGLFAALKWMLVLKWRMVNTKFSALQATCCLVNSRPHIPLLFRIYLLADSAKRSEPGRLKHRGRGREASAPANRHSINQKRALQLLPSAREPPASQWRSGVAAARSLSRFLECRNQQWPSISLAPLARPTQPAAPFHPNPSQLAI